MKPGDLLAVHCHPENVVYQWFREDPLDTEIPRELRTEELVTYTGVAAVSGSIGYLKVISRHGMGWISKDCLREIPP